MTHRTMRYGRMIGAGLLACAACATTAPAAGAAPATKDEALALYQQTLNEANVPAGWTGSGCTVGTESQASLDATLRTLNILRYFSDLTPVTFDATFNAKALAAATMMKAANKLSHSPGPGWPCYTQDGADGAGSSNLFLGLSGAEAMVGYVNDAGVGSLGHRRWVLDPAGAVFGSGSTGSTNALYVIGGGASLTPPADHVAWPPRGWTPWPWVFEDWSVAVRSPTGEAVDLSAAQVSVTINGVPAVVTGTTDLGSGFGAWPTLKWNVFINDQTRTVDAAMDVSINGVTAGGQPVPISYRVQAFPVPRPQQKIEEEQEERRPTVSRSPYFRSGPKIRRADGRNRAIRRGTRVQVRFSAARASRTRIQWLRNGRTISGARSRTYKVSRRDRGKSLGVRVTLTGSDGSTRSKTVSRRVGRR